MPSTTNKPIIFLAFANDRDDSAGGYLRHLGDEMRGIREVLEKVRDDGLCDLEIRSDCTLDDIFKVFQDAKYRNRVAIFHFGGHANSYNLLLEASKGQSVTADAGGLAAFFGEQRGLQLVFLNGCSTQHQAERLLDANVSAVISTSRSINDEVAAAFSSKFYQGLAGGATIRTAYNEAEATVQAAKGGNARALYFGGSDDSQSRLEADRWPWNLYFREGSESAAQWNLPTAANDPLFGLPPLPAEDLPESPYRHLNRFTCQDAEVFFGRGHQVRELYDRLTDPRSAPILLFYGQSGVGKSSILDAGLMPRLSQGCEVRYLRRTAGGLLDTLRLAFLPEAAGLPIETAWRVKEEQLGKPLIVFLDQVEEVYTRPVADLSEELTQFLDAVKATFFKSQQRPQGKLVLGFRKEWLAELEALLIDYELPRNKVLLEPLDRRGIIEVVQGPAQSERLRQRYGITVEDGLAEIIADDLLADRDSAIAPTLQILLTKLWTNASRTDYEHPHFSQDLYRDLKRDGILLRDFLDQQIAAFRERYPDAVDSGLLLDILALHTTPLGTTDQWTVEQLQDHYVDLGIPLPDLLQQCQDLHLLTVTTSTQKESSKTSRLAHDTLAPLVRKRLDESDLPGQRARRILNTRALDWFDGRTGAPLDEADLETVEAGLRGTRKPTGDESRLLESSRGARTQRRMIRRGLLVAAVSAAVAITTFGGLAYTYWREATAALRDQEKATHLLGGFVETSLALNQYDSDPLAAMSATIQLYRELSEPKDPVPASMVRPLRHYTNSLVESLRSFSAKGRIAWLGTEVEQVVADPNGDYLVVLGPGVEVRHAGNGSRLRKLEMTNYSVNIFPLDTPDTSLIVSGGGGSAFVRIVGDQVTTTKLLPYVSTTKLSHDPQRSLLYVTHTAGYSETELLRTKDGSPVTSMDGFVPYEFGIGEASDLMIVQKGTQRQLRRVSDQSIVSLPKPIRSVRFLTDKGGSGEAVWLRVAYADKTKQWFRILANQLIAPADEPIADVDLTDDDSHALVRFEDGTSAIYRLRDAKRIQTLPPGTEKAEFSDDPQSTFLVLTRPSGLEVLRTRSDGEIAFKLPSDASIEFSTEPGAARCVVFYKDRPAELRDTTGGRVVSLLHSGAVASYEPVRQVKFLPPESADCCLVGYYSGRQVLVRSENGEWIKAFDDPVENVQVFPEQGFFVAQNKPPDAAAEAAEPNKVAYRFSDGEAILPAAMGSTRGDAPAGFTRGDNSRTRGDDEALGRAAHVVSTDPSFPFYVHYLRNATNLYHLGTFEPWPSLPAAIEVRKADPKDTLGTHILVKADHGSDELWRVSDQTKVASFANEVANFSFVQGSNQSLFTVDFNTGRAELWQTGATSMRLSDLGVDVSSVHYIPSKSTLAVLYRDARAYLLNVNWLRQLEGKANSHSPAELIRIAEAALGQKSTAPLQDGANNSTNEGR